MILDESITFGGVIADMKLYEIHVSHLISLFFCNTLIQVCLLSIVTSLCLIHEVGVFLSPLSYQVICRLMNVSQTWVTRNKIDELLEIICNFIVCSYQQVKVSVIMVVNRNHYANYQSNSCLDEEAYFSLLP